MSVEKDISTTLKTGRSLFLLQLLSRLVTFVLNSSLLRLSTPEVLGTASIQFDLISATILFLSREGIRNALLRREDRSQRSSANDRLACMPLFLGIGVASIVVTLYRCTSSTATTSQTDFDASLGLYVLAALIELSIEPFYIRCLTSTPPRLRVRVQAEGLMALTKAIVTFTLLYFYPNRALLGFGIGQFCGNGILASRYLVEYGTDGYIWIRDRGDKTFGPLVNLAVANTRQSFIKHLLTEADRIAVGRISPLADQGGYAIAMNYGSLIARIVFQPIEETLLLHFAASPKAPTNAPLLSMIAHLSFHLLVLLPAFVPPLLPPILAILLPKRYILTSAPHTLKIYLSSYIPLLSLNGILEAYHAATATPAKMSIQARVMIASSAIFVATLWLTRGHVRNETALIGASCTGMLLRIAYAFNHARQTAGLNIRTLFPKKMVSVVVVISGVTLRTIYHSGRWRHNWKQWFELLGSGVVMGLVVLAVIWRAERNSFQDLSAKLKTKSQ